MYNLKAYNRLASPFYPPANAASVDRLGAVQVHDFQFLFFQLPANDSELAQRDGYQSERFRPQGGYRRQLQRL